MEDNRCTIDYVKYRRPVVCTYDYLDETIRFFSSYHFYNDQRALAISNIADRWPPTRDLTDQVAASCPRNFRRAERE